MMSVFFPGSPAGSSLGRRQFSSANSNSEITYSLAHGTLSALVQAQRDGREGAIRFSSPEIRHTGGVMLVRTPPAVLG